MALSQQHRRTIHQRLAPILGEEETDAMLSQFPTSEADEPATRADLATLRAATRSDLADLRAATKNDLTDLRAATTADLADLRAATKNDLTDLRAATTADLADVRAEVHDIGRQMVMWSTGAVIGGMGLAAAIGAAFGA